MNRQSRLQPLARAVLRTQPDHRLVALAREGRDSAFDEIVRRYRPGLVAFAAAYAPRDSAEDVVQEALAAAWRAMRESETEIQLKPWLYTIVRNRALNARRDARPHEPLGEEIDGVRQPDEIALTNEELERAVAAVHALPPAQRKALVRSALDGRTHGQIAAELGSTPGAVGQLVFRARAGLSSGLGLLIPLPLLRLLLEPGAEAAAGATGVGAAAAAAGGGGSMLAKGAAIGIVGVIAAGSGVAIERSTRSSDTRDAPVASRTAEDGGGSARGSGPGLAATTTSSGETGSGGNGSSSGGGASSGPGPSGENERDDGDGESGDDGGGVNSGPGSASSGPSASSGSGSDGDEREDDFDDSGSSGSGHSGSGGGGDSGSGSSGSGHSGSGSDSGEDEVEVEEEDVTTPTTTTTVDDDFDDDNSGSGSSGSGSSGSGSSGSGGSGSD